jgi:hypothetical protein
MFVLALIVERLTWRTTEAPRRRQKCSPAASALGERIETGEPCKGDIAGVNGKPRMKMPPFQGFWKEVLRIPGLTPLGCASFGPLGLQFTTSHSPALSSTGSFNRNCFTNMMVV